MQSRLSKEQARVYLARRPTIAGIPQAKKKQGIDALTENVPQAWDGTSNYVLEGNTQNFSVYYDQANGNNSKSMADSVLQSCEGDLAKISALFGNIQLPSLPLSVFIFQSQETGNGFTGAYHYGCDGTDIYVDSITSPTLMPDLTRAALVAEVTEVFEAAQATGWD